MQRSAANLFARLWAPSLLFLVAALYCTPIGLRGINIYDEGIRLHGAERVLNGEVPYRDFYAIYGPAQFYWPALLFKVFGHQVAVFRVSIVLFTALLTMAVFLLCRQAGVGVAGSLLGSLLLLLPRNGGSVDLMYCDPAVPLILLGGLILANRPSGRIRIAAGVLLGTAALFRYDFGVYGVLAATAGSIFEALTVDAPFRQRFHRAATGLAWLFLGVVATAGVAYGVLAALDFPPLRTNLLTFPAVATYYRMLPFPFESLRTELFGINWTLSRTPLYVAMTTLLRCLVYIAPFVTAGVVVWRFPSILKLRSWKPHQAAFTTVFLGFFLPGLLLYGLGRSDWAHLLPFFSVSVPFVAVVLRSNRTFSNGRRNAETFRRIALGFASIAAVCIFASRTADYMAAPPLDLERTRGIALELGESDWFVAAVHDLAEESGPLFVAADRHDVIFINAVMLYFLSGREPGTYFSQLDPGIATTEAVQQRIVADLKKNNVSTVLMWSAGPFMEPNLSSQSSGVLLLDTYLLEDYYVAKRRENYSILKRRL